MPRRRLALLRRRSVRSAPARAAQKPATAAPAPVVADTEAHDIVVETNDVHAVFSTQGAVLKSWQLKRYLIDKVPFELVPQDIPAGLASPFTLATDDAALGASLLCAVQTERRAHARRRAGRADVRDRTRLASARKTFHFQPDGKAYNLGVRERALM